MDAAFINTQNLVDLGLINTNVEDSVLEVLIQRVQKSTVRPLLGTSLYNRISEGIDNSNLNADEVKLMDEYVIPLLVIAVDRKAINSTTYQIRNKATTKGIDPNVQPVSESENLRLDNDIRQDLVIAENDLIGYLRDNCELYPEYNNAECSYEMHPPSKERANNIAFGLV